MLNVLLESKAKGTRRIGGTVTSTLVHAAVIALVIALTVPKPIVAHDGPKQVETVFIAHPRPLPQARTEAAPHHIAPASVTPPTPGPVLRFDEHSLPVIGQIDPSTIAPTTPTEFGSGVQTSNPIGAVPGLGSPDGVVEERFVDRSPRLIGSPTQPTFPPSLRQSGRAGRVLVQFVVDTAGRAEMDGFKVMETSDPLFAESIRAVLPRYRFSAGEAGGRKVRTLVQLPFDFTLVR
jgi:periplasmic protein TonB